MSRNMVQFQKGLSDARFDEMYGSEERCHAALVQLRWPDGFECPDCREHGHCLVNRGARRLFQCNACRKQTSVKAGTIFASSKLPLRIWFKAIFLLTQSKKAGSPARRHPDDSLGNETQARASHARAQREQAIERRRADGRRLHRRRSSGSARTRGQGQDAVRGGGRHNGRRKTRSDHPAACQSVQPCRDPQARRYGARPRRPSLDRRFCVFRGRRRRRMRARRDQDRRRPASRQNARLQIGQHGAGQYQGGFGRNLSSRTFQACSALSRGVRISVQPQIQSRRHDSASRFCGAQDRAHALPAPEVS